MIRKRIVLIGAGGMAREVAAAIKAHNRMRHEFEFLGFIVSNRQILGAYDSRSEVLGDYEWLVDNRKCFDAMVVGVGSPSIRLRVVEEAKSIFPNVEWPNIVHPSAEFDKDSARLTEGNFVGAGFVGTVNLNFEPFALCNFGCTVGHESVLGRGSVVNPGANISGGVVLGAGVLIGTGAQVLQYITVGDGATVGSGAVVTKDVLPGITVLGIPAKPLQRTEEL